MLANYDMVLHLITCAKGAEFALSLIHISFYIACSSFVGQNYGAGKSRRVLTSYLLTLCSSAVAAAVLGGLFLPVSYTHLLLLKTGAVTPLSAPSPPRPAWASTTCSKWSR